MPISLPEGLITNNDPVVVQGSAIGKIYVRHKYTQYVSLPTSTTLQIPIDDATANNSSVYSVSYSGSYSSLSANIVKRKNSTSSTYSTGDLGVKKLESDGGVVPNLRAKFSDSRIDKSTQLTSAKVTFYWPQRYIGPNFPSTANQTEDIVWPTQNPTYSLSKKVTAYSHTTAGSESETITFGLSTSHTDKTIYAYMQGGTKWGYGAMGSVGTYQVAIHEVTFKNSTTVDPYISIPINATSAGTVTVWVDTLVWQYEGDPQSPIITLTVTADSRTSCYAKVQVTNNNAWDVGASITVSLQNIFEEIDYSNRSLSLKPGETKNTGSIYLDGGDHIYRVTAKCRFSWYDSDGTLCFTDWTSTTKIHNTYPSETTET